MTKPHEGYPVARGVAAPPDIRWTPAPPPHWGPAPPGKRASTGGPPERLAEARGGVALPLVLLIVLVAVLGAVWPGFFKQKVFDAAAVQQGVLTVLRDDYQLDADNVACPTGQPVEVDSRFSCSAQIAGAPKTVTITVKSSDGRFEVGLPQ
ncbi:DUF4333 domain-containing protein [Micromonospora profundi]|uniref:DUF4333 domain-containing protein n=1 Tax=Micromonospora profundi TaxID=1420889 RepID=UPI00366A0AC7